MSESVVHVAFYIGYIAMVLGGICLLMALLCWAAILSNRAQHALIDTLGGWKVFMEYREWFHSREDKKP